MSRDSAPAAFGIDLYWLPLGAGGRFVELNGRTFEALEAMIARRRPLDLYHSALEVTVAAGTFVIEIAPIPRGPSQARGVIGDGAVGSRHAPRWRIFRYELRCWGGGLIADVAEAVESPRRIAADEAGALRLLDLVPSVPMAVWGRDELRAGEMWNSNSVISWLLVINGSNVEDIQPPPGGRAPGWDAGVTVARRSGAGAGPRVSPR